MINYIKEVASSSDVQAPSFHFYDGGSGVKGREYRNNGTDIDFVTSNGNLYVCVVDHECEYDSVEKDPNFLLIVSKGEQGEQGIQGRKGADGKTPSVFARFDGHQMIFYTLEIDETGKEVKKRIACTNDLTGPSWRPELVDDTIVWHKTKSDEAPKSINLAELRTQSSPVIFRVDSDNTKRTDVSPEQTGPAKFIQWKYEGDEYWNNLISIDDLMNLTLAGLTIWQEENVETGAVDYHFAHKEVIKATYDSTPEGKRIISEVELGDSLLEFGKFSVPKYTDFTYDIEVLNQIACELKQEVERINEELKKFVKTVSVNGATYMPDEDQNVTLPDYYTKDEADNLLAQKQPKGNYLTSHQPIKSLNGESLVGTGNVSIPIGYTKAESDAKYQPKDNYVKSVNNNKPDSNGNVTISIPSMPDLSGYLKKSDLKLKLDPTTKLLSVSYDGGTTWNDIGITCTCDHTTPTAAIITVKITPTSGKVVVAGKTYSNGDKITGYNVGDSFTWSASATGFSSKTGTKAVVAANDTLTIELTETAISVSPNPVDFNANGGTKTVTITSTETPTIGTPSCTWVTISDKTNTGFKVTAAENTSTVSRSCTVQISAGGKHVDVAIEQAGRAEELVTLTVTNTDKEDTIKVNNVDYTAPMQLAKGTKVNITATRDGYTASFKIKDSDVQMPFTITEDTEVIITWIAGTIPVNGVSLDKTTANLDWASCVENDTLQLTAAVSPEDASNKNVTWSSSDSNVATVNESGEVTPVGTGSTTITVKTDNGSKEATCAVTVTAKEVHATKVTISDTQNLVKDNKATIHKTNKSLDLEYSVEPECCNDEFEWEIVDTNIATIDSDGKVTPKNTGTTTVQLNNKSGRESSSIELEIFAEDQVVHVEKLSLDHDTLVLSTCEADNNNYGDIKVEVKPDGATNKSFSWEPKEFGVITVQKSLLNDNIVIVTAKSAGTETITFISTDGKKSAECVVTVTDKCGEPVVEGVRLHNQADQNTGCDITYSIGTGSMNTVSYLDVAVLEGTGTLYIDVASSCDAGKIEKVIIDDNNNPYVPSQEESQLDGSHEIEIPYEVWSSAQDIYVHLKARQQELS